MNFTLRRLPREVSSEQGGLDHDDAGRAEWIPQTPNSSGTSCAMGLHGAWFSLAAFGLLYSGLVILGLVLRESSQQLTILWPAAGLLFMTLWSIAAAQLDLDFGRTDGGGTLDRRRAVRPFYLAAIRAVRSRQFARRDRWRAAGRAAHELPGSSQDPQCIAVDRRSCLGRGGQCGTRRIRLGPTDGGGPTICANGSYGGRGTGWDRCASHRS